MTSLKELNCRHCGDPVKVDLDCGKVLCGRCLMGSANRYARLALTGHENEELRKADYKDDARKCKRLIKDLGSATVAAEALGITRRTLYQWARG